LPLGSGELRFQSFINPRRLAGTVRRTMPDVNLDMSFNLYDTHTKYPEKFYIAGLLKPTVSATYDATWLVATIGHSEATGDFLLLNDGMSLLITTRAIETPTLSRIELPEWILMLQRAPDPFTFDSETWNPNVYLAHLHVSSGMDASGRNWTLASFQSYCVLVRERGFKCDDENLEKEIMKELNMFRLE